MKYRTSSLILAIFTGIVFSSPAVADKTYTPAQLRSMAKSGNYPKQGAPSTQTQYMDYSVCISKMSAIVGAVRAEYPTSTILSTNIARIEKVWTNDAAMTFTCSAPDGKLVITSAPYR